MLVKWMPAVVAEAAEDAEAPEGKAAGSGSPLTLVASVEEEDRAGDVILAKGWDLAAYERNPVLLWAHDYRRPAIGRSLRTWVEPGGDGAPGRLMATVEFAPTPFAQEVRSLYAGGFMRGVSVGFRALETEPREGREGRRGLLFKRQELLEISAAPVPVNAGALSSASAGEPSVLSHGEDAACPSPTVSGRGDHGEALSALEDVRALWQDLATLVGACPVR